jgi:putative PIN family toxin of toxin-antitoxin system
MILTMDTNVLVQALSNNKGASYFILNLIYEEKIKLAISIPVFYEYEDVLNRANILKLIGLNQNETSDVLTLIFHFAEKHKIFYLFRPNLRDEKDNIFIELAVKSNSKYLITSNTTDFNNNELKFPELKIITPGEFVKMWRKQNEKES